MGIGKRSADAEPTADADAYYSGYSGHGAYGYRSYGAYPYYRSYGYHAIGKRSADAEPTADADAYYWISCLWIQILCCLPLLQILWLPRYWQEVCWCLALQSRILRILVNYPFQPKIFQAQGMKTNCHNRNKRFEVPIFVRATDPIQCLQVYVPSHVNLLCRNKS